MADFELLGLHTPRLDEKGRLALPARFRDALGENIVVTKSPERCLSVYPHAVFRERVSGPLEAASTASRNVRTLRRAYLPHAATMAPDRQGRITIPPLLRAFANLDKDCTVVGQGFYLEIWEPHAWARIEASTDVDLAELDQEGVIHL